jgi:TctA family transporter
VSYESTLITKARASVRRLLLLCLVSFCGFFAYGASVGSKPLGLGIFTGIVFGLPVAIAAWFLLGVIRFGFGSPSRY